MDKLCEPLGKLSECGLPGALEAMGERWSFMILRASFNGIRHFEDFLSELGIARNILASRLTQLTSTGILARTHCEDDRRKIEYRLTAKGTDLLPAMIALRQWGEKWSTGVPSDPVLVDERDHRPIAAVTIRSHDDRILLHNDLCWTSIEDIKLSEQQDALPNREKSRKLSAI
jgi:DNA-binding HxlR family transcriptional regulator